MLLKNLNYHKMKINGELIYVGHQDKKKLINKQT